MGAVLCIDVPQSLVDAAATSVAGLSLERMRSPGQALAVVGRGSTPVEGIVVGSRIQEPVSVAQRFAMIDPDIPVVVIVEEGAVERTRMAIQIAPLIGNDVQCLGQDAARTDLGTAVADAISRRNLARTHRATLRAITTQTSEPAVEDGASEAPPRAATQDSSRDSSQDTRRWTPAMGQEVDAIVDIDATSVVTNWSPRAETLFGWTADEAVGQRLASLIMPSRFQMPHLRGVRRAWESEIDTQGRRFEVSALHKEGHEIPVELTVWRAEGGFTSQIRDLTEHRRSLQTARTRVRTATLRAEVAQTFIAPPTLRDALLSAAEAIVEHAEAAHVQIWIASDAGPQLIVGAGSARTPVMAVADEHPVSRLIDAGVPAVMRPGHPGSPYEAEWTEGARVEEIRAYPFRGVGTTGVILVSSRSPIGEEMDRALRSCATLVTRAAPTSTGVGPQADGSTDVLTGLPGREVLGERIQSALARCARAGTNVAVMFCDMDRFKLINDSRGHLAGDHFLIAIADRLRRTARAGDTVARFGGDEFVIVAENLRNEEEAQILADRVARAIELPVPLDDGDILPTASIGIALGSTNDTAESMIRDADIAMYRAKERGRARVEFFDESLRAKVERRISLEHDLRKALETRSIHAMFLPMVSPATWTVVAVEAVPRWSQPGEEVQPSEFLPIAEEAALMEPLAEIIYEEAFRAAREWIDALGDDAPRLAINVSPRQLSGESNIVDRLVDLMRRHGIPPDMVTVEIAEGVLMKDIEFAIESLLGLRSLGVRLAVDDFGIGHSSFTVLRRFPIDRIKIHESFQSGAGTNPNESAIVAAIIAMGQALGLEVAAQGVSTEVELQELAALGCSLVQGTAVAPSLDEPQLVTFLQEHVGRRSP